jgi:hypothetical protein
VAALNHPNILAVIDIGQHNGSPFLVSELLEGESLRAVLDRGPVRTAEDDRVRSADCARTRGCAREGDRASGFEAGECFRHATGASRFWILGMKGLLNAELGASDGADAVYGSRPSVIRVTAWGYRYKR